MAKLLPQVFDKEYAIIQINDIYKDGYTTICCIPAWLRNNYRELSLEKAVELVNQWIDDYNIKHEKLCLLPTKNRVYVLTETKYNEVITEYKRLKAIKEAK